MHFPWLRFPRPRRPRRPRSMAASFAFQEMKSGEHLPGDAVFPVFSHGKPIPLRLRNQDHQAETAAPLQTIESYVQPGPIVVMLSWCFRSMNIVRFAGYLPTKHR